MHQQNPEMGKSRWLYSEVELHGGVGNLLIYKRTLVRDLWYENQCPDTYRERWSSYNLMRRSSRNSPILRGTPAILQRDQGRSPDLYTGPLWRKEDEISAKSGPRTKLLVLSIDRLQVPIESKTKAVQVLAAPTRIYTGTGARPVCRCG